MTERDTREVTIERYRFGQIVINGRSYASDVIIYPDGRVEDQWRRRRGHELVAADIDSLVASAPEVIVVGTGASGRLVPDPRLAGDLDALGIRMEAVPSESAMTLFNDLKARYRLGACFHLTC